MDPSDRPPFVVFLDDSDEPGDVLDSLALGPFVAGVHPIAKTRQLTRVSPDATFVPQTSSTCRVAEAPWRTVTLSEGDGWCLKATRWRDGTVTLIVTAVDDALADRLLAEISTNVTEPPPASGLSVPVGFWHLAGRGARRSARSIEVASWESIRRNYTAGAAGELDELMAVTSAKLTGRLLLLYGPPGTGKTSVIRAITHEWRDWCATDYVLDPEQLLRDAGYLTSVLLDSVDEEETDTSQAWRLLVLEDCDEVIRSEAKAGAGQALSRLLNVTDGLLGQGRNTLICITTNEDLSRFHPAVVRPGRCLKQVQIGPLDRHEAAAWLGVDTSDWPNPATLAELYATQSGNHTFAAPPAPSVGQYL
jgi:Domain of unknown function (DUF5925)/ATPase family associated with various cellular activities (AAA)